MSRISFYCIIVWGGALLYLSCAPLLCIFATEKIERKHQLGYFFRCDQRVFRWGTSASAISLTQSHK